jgi:hypothetical protein
MEKLADHVRKIFEDRLARHACMVIYDPHGRYRPVAASLEKEKRSLVFADDGPIESIEMALRTLRVIGTPKSGIVQLLVYVPSAPPVSEMDRCRDPFASVAVAGAVFPDGDGDGYEAVCHDARPEFRRQITELFKAGEPDFPTIDAVGGGTGWPRLQSQFGVESATEILVTLLSPSAAQLDQIKADTGCISEAKEFTAATLGFHPKTKSASWAIIRDELWRFVLFSEFYYDLPNTPPAALESVPRAKADAIDLVNRACEELRCSEKHQALYLDQAARIAAELDLENRMREVEDLGSLDTFAFEERSFLTAFVRATMEEKWQAAERIEAQRRSSIWVKQTDRQILWTSAGRARKVIARADDIERDLKPASGSLGELINFYAARSHLLDQEQREFEQSVADAMGELEGVEPLIELARQRYRSVAEKQQQVFIRLVRQEAWPAPGVLRATRIFSDSAKALLETRTTRVALFMVDALRYELGAALENQISSEYTCTLKPACAQLPTITKVGMAALLPETDGKMSIESNDGRIRVFLGGVSVETPADRLAHARKVYGDGCDMILLDELLSISGTKKQNPISDQVRLLLVRTTEIDSHGEQTVAAALDAVPRVLSKVVAALSRLRKLGFTDAVIAADHGFMLFGDRQPGEKAALPVGKWNQVKDRCCVGEGDGGQGVSVMISEDVGIPGNFKNYGVPDSFSTFSEQTPYFHEGLSLQEALIPALHVTLGTAQTETALSADVQIRYRGETTGTVTTLRPVVEVAVFGGDIFAQDLVRFRLEAWSKPSGEKTESVVGEPAACQEVEPATGFVHMRPGHAAKIPLRLAENVDGPIEIRATDADTGVTLGLPLKLKVKLML